jgi:phytoene dehydrogenase-like protein
VLRTLALKYPAAFASTLLAAPKILAPFDVAAYGVTSPFLINYMNMIAFLLQGLPADQTLTAVMAYMVDDFYRPGAVLDFPKGGSSALVKPLVDAIAAAGGSVHTSSPVAAITVGKGGEASGVRLESGREVRASKAVVYVRGGGGARSKRERGERAVRGRVPPPPRAPARATPARVSFPPPPRSRPPRHPLALHETTSRPTSLTRRTAGPVWSLARDLEELRPVARTSTAGGHSSPTRVHQTRSR